MKDPRSKQNHSGACAELVGVRTQAGSKRERERTELPAQACTQPMQLQFSQAWQADPANHDTVEESVLQDRILGGKKLEMKGSWALEYHTLILFSLKEPV